MIAIFLFLLAIFLISAYIGYLFNGDVVEEIFKEFGSIANLDPISLFVVIFLNNSLKSLLAILLGFFFGIFPIFFVSVNGYILGAVFSIKKDLGLIKLLLAILPHGIIEIPAILIASSYGVHLGYRFALALFKNKEFKPYLFKALKVYFKVVLPMLLIAAFIETFITPALL